MLSDDLIYARDKLDKGYPVSAVAKMVGRPVESLKALLEFRKAADLPVAVPAPLPPTPARLQDQAMDAVCKPILTRNGFSLDDMLGPSRRFGLVDCRQEIMFALHAAGYPDHRIGKYLGGRDRSTIIHGRNAHRRGISA